MEGLIFGPVTSRRFGISLGVDLSPNEKRCNFDCLYCELAGAKPVSFIKDPILPEVYIETIKKSLKEFPQSQFITLTANGEPTLYPYLDELVDMIKALHVKQKVLILSNGSTIMDPKIAATLHKIDVVKLSLDAVSERTFKRIDRPIKGLHVKDIIQGLKQFSKEHKGIFILEVLVVKGLNDTVEEFEKLNDAIGMIKPDRVDVGTIARPPAYKVQGVSKKELEVLAAIIENIPVTIPWEASYASFYEFNKKDLLELLKKRPQNADDVKRSFSPASKLLLDELIEAGVVRIQEVAGVKFYKA